MDNSPNAAISRKMTTFARRTLRLVVPFTRSAYVGGQFDEELLPQRRKTLPR
jgi:hypothetical protein